MSEQNLNVITAQGKAELEKEKKNLIEVERPRIIQLIKEAREQGDLSENAEFDAAREEQGKIEDRINEINGILESSTVAAETAADIVHIGSKVVIAMERNGWKEREITLVGSQEANSAEGKVSNISPVGKALLNAKAGETVEVVIDSKNKYSVKVISIAE